MSKRTRAQMQRAKLEAMPEVKKLVQKYGRTAISGCLTKLKEYEKQAKELASLKIKVAELEKGLT